MPSKFFLRKSRITGFFEIPIEFVGIEPTAQHVFLNKQERLTCRDAMPGGSRLMIMFGFYVYRSCLVGNRDINTKHEPPGMAALRVQIFFSFFFIFF